MRQRASWIFFSTFLALALIGLVLTFPRLTTNLSNVHADELHPPITKIDPALYEALAAQPSDQTHRFIVHLSGKADLSPPSLPSTALNRRSAIVNRLQKITINSQNGIASDLKLLEAQGEISDVRSLWIINALSIQGTPAAITKLASHPQVTNVELDEAIAYFESLEMSRSGLANQESLLSSPTNGETAVWGVKRILAHKAIELLNVDGRGTTVAIMDTGVDWQHPGLLQNYRGNNGDGTFDHEANWFYPAQLTSTMPIDLHGHGTHVAGTAVGKGGIGVAPGADWIAVAIANESGFAYDSDIHAGFQWLLAPAGDPARAPDIVNNSWGGQGTRTEFLEDVQILEEAGIISVFASGNQGPEEGSIQSPASFPNTIAVGASDDQDFTAWFSSRGPSPLAVETKPLLTAPGTHIFSTLPGENYGFLNGTSMATPHVSGAIALILSADPTLNANRVKSLLSESATSLTDNHPNMTNGWGRLNVLDALISLRPHGLLNGKIHHQGTGLAGVKITIINKNGGELEVFTEDNGDFEQILPVGKYDIHVSNFGYENDHQDNIQMVADHDQILNFNLRAKPFGQVRGEILDKIGFPVKAKITISSTPLSFMSNESGAFSFNLPVGNYLATFEAVGYELERRDLNIVENGSQRFNQVMEDAPSILLVDSGQYRYESVGDIYLEALAANNLTSDVWQVDDPTSKVPTIQDLDPYEIVIWSSPSDSPGSIYANDILTDYLGIGGNLLISGPNVALKDGHPDFPLPWFQHKLRGEFRGKIDLKMGEINVAGNESSLFSGLSFSLQNERGSPSSIAPDAVQSLDPLTTRAAFTYEEGSTAGLIAGFCQPFRILQLGFGLDKITTAQDRAAIINRAVASFSAPRQELGVMLNKDSDLDYVLPGSKYQYTLSIQNSSEIITDTFYIAFDSYDWSSSILTPTISLGACQDGLVDIQIEVPRDQEWDALKKMSLTAVSQTDSRIKHTFELSFKTPGQILLVDDDRFYDRQQIYTEALDSLGLIYDVWESGSGNEGRGSPPEDILNAYEYVIWYTGYDWFNPITPDENESLQKYLAQGGRLFISSQDFLYYNIHTELTRDYLGIIDYHESITPTQTYANQELVAAPELAGPLALHYEPYQNFSDGLIPQADSQPFLWHDQGMPAAIAHEEPGYGRAVFFGFPFETLPVGQHSKSLESVLGWLSDLGDTTIKSEARTVRAGETNPYTISLRNSNDIVTHHLVLTNTLPLGTILVPGSLDETYHYSPRLDQISWQGSLLPGEQKTIQYQLQTIKSLPPGTRLDNHLTIFNAQDNLPIKKVASTWVDAPDLSRSTLSVMPNEKIPVDMISYTLTLHNGHLGGSGLITAVVTLPEFLHPLKGTLNSNYGEVEIDKKKVTWTGSLEHGESISTSLVVTRSQVFNQWLPVTAIIEDGVTDPVILFDLQHLPPQRLFLPIFPHR